MRKMPVSIFLALILVAPSAASFAADNAVRAKASVDKDNAYIGDVINYTIELSGKEPFEADFTKIAQNTGPFTVRTGGDVSVRDNGTRHFKKFLITTYTTGDETIPSLEVPYRFKGEESWKVAKTDPVKIKVKSLLAENPKANDIKDIKGILRPPANIFLNIAIAILALAVAAALIFLIKKILSRRKVAPPKPAHVLAYEELERIKMSGLVAEGKVKEYYFRLSSCIRHYLERRFSLRAPEMTLEEFFEAVGVSDVLDESHKKLLKDFLASCDMVKFAKYSPDRQEIESSYDFAKRFVDETKETAATGKNKQ